MNVAEIALSKPYVESVCIHCIADGSPQTLPGCGVLREDGSPKVHSKRLKAWRAGLTSDEKK